MSTTQTLEERNDEVRARLAEDVSMAELRLIAAERGISPRNFTKDKLKQHILKWLHRQEGYMRLGGYSTRSK